MKLQRGAPTEGRPYKVSRAPLFFPLNYGSIRAMLTVKALLFLALGAFLLVYLFIWWSAARRNRQGEPIAPTPEQSAIGFVTNFFDTLGIGSFATTTSCFRLRKVVRDEHIPGTLNVGHTLPTFVQALIYISIIEVDMKTLVLMIAAAVMGSWLGAGVVAGWERRKIQIGMGTALLVAATLMLLKQLDLLPGGGVALGLEGSALAIGLIGNFTFGALMSLGIGLYAPCLILISVLGMSPTTAFPIMMGSCAFLMPVASARFIRKGSYDLRAALGLALGGIPAVLIAAYLVVSLPLSAVRWLVVVVVVFTALAMLKSAISKRTGVAELRARTSQSE
ncbi:MAG TPA: sulfite exporter TauE/SafE family protein [Blastocatellia bacterium]|nr:sulfite exporter TauE/SafE family protein [Blastocatellia bacterium]